MTINYKKLFPWGPSGDCIIFHRFHFKFDTPSIQIIFLSAFSIPRWSVDPIRPVVRSARKSS